MSAVAELEVFHDVGPDEQNARVPIQAMNYLGTKRLLSSEQWRCGRPDKVDKRTHALVRYSEYTCQVSSTSAQQSWSLMVLKTLTVHGCTDVQTDISPVLQVISEEISKYDHNI